MALPRKYLIELRGTDSQYDVPKKIEARFGVLITRAAYQHWETGRRSPAIDILGFLADIYNKSLDELARAEFQYQREAERSA